MVGGPPEHRLLAIAPEERFSAQVLIVHGSRPFLIGQLVKLNHVGDVVLLLGVDVESTGAKQGNAGQRDVAPERRGGLGVLLGVPLEGTERLCLLPVGFEGDVMVLAGEKTA